MTEALTPVGETRSEQRGIVRALKTPYPKPHRPERIDGADNGTRTRGLNLGKVALYQLSYVRKGIRREKRNPVGDVGIEPTTPSV